MTPQQHLAALHDVLNQAVTPAPRARLRPVSAYLPAPVKRSRGRPPAPPTLTPQERADISEALVERAAIREFEGGEPRAVAEANALAEMRVYLLHVAMDPGHPPRRVTMIAPGVEPAEAIRIAAGQFGPERVLDLVELGPGGVVNRPSNDQ